MSSGKRKSEDNIEGVSKKLFSDPEEPSSSQSKINISPSIARNPNKYLGAGSHKKNLQDAIESRSQSSSQGLRTPTKSPKKRLSKFSPFKRSPGKSPRKEMFPKQLDDQETDRFISSYDRTFEKVLLVATVQMREWLEQKHTEESLVDLDILDKFTSLNQSSKNLYVRLVNRKHAWLKKSQLEEKYGKWGSDVMADLYIMTDAGVIEADYYNEELSILLNLLQVAELKDLCKFLKVATSQMKKSELIDAIVQFSKNQRSIFGGDNSSTIKQLIGSRYLGECVRLTHGPRDAFLACVILVTFSFYHELTDHVTRLNDYVSRIVRTTRGDIKFPDYRLHRTCVFRSRNSFEHYIKAFELCTEIDIACREKSMGVVPLLKQALQNLRETLRDKEAMAEIEARPIYLRRYSAGYLYVKTIMAKLNLLKKDFPNIAEEALRVFLGQKYFRDQERGVWYESLAQLYMVQLKDNNKAASTLLEAFDVLEQQRLDKRSPDEIKQEAEKPCMKLKDLSWIKYSLIERATLLKKRQKGRIDEDKSAALSTWIADIEPLVAPDVALLSGKLMPNTNKGRKQIYMVEGEDGRTYMSVEERAKTHFQKQGYSQSRHDEGATLKSILYALFWEVIYTDPKYNETWGVFQSPYQQVPLDWRTPNFFERRKGKIRKRLDEIAQMEPSQLIENVMQVAEEHAEESSVITWSCIAPENVNILTNLVTCIGLPLFLQIGEYIIKDVDHNSKGFPDLTMWNPNQNKAIFVEVKSQNDRLSVQQKVWLHKLKTWGANCCVAHLRHTGGVNNTAQDVEKSEPTSAVL